MMIYKNKIQMFKKILELNQIWLLPNTKCNITCISEYEMPKTTNSLYIAHISL